MREALVLTALALLAGCVTGLPPPPDDPPPLTPPPVLDASRGGCADQNLGLLVPIGQAQAALPDGWTARDVRYVTDAPTDTGRGLVAVVFTTCAHSALEGGPVTEAEVMVYVDAPDVPVEVPARTREGSDFLVLDVVTDSERTRALLGGSEGRVELVQETGPTGWGVEARATDADGVLYETTALTPGEALRTETNHYWYETADGLTLRTATRDDHRQLAGTQVVCWVREGSAAARAAGFATCGTVPNLAVAYPSGDLSGALHRWPGLAVRP